mgnify:CR=1 FL=1
MHKLHIPFTTSTLVFEFDMNINTSLTGGFYDKNNKKNKYATY